MRILIFGGDGMLGHQLLKSYSHRHQVWVTLHGDPSVYHSYELFDSKNAKFEVDVFALSKIENILDELKPQVVVNCIGVVKQRKESKDAISSIKVNALWPHQLSYLCEKRNFRLIQISTDCVFSGEKGNCSESDIPDARDLYGRTKLLGEVVSKNAITLRTSIIGLELSRYQGLIEWFLSQHGKIQGYANAIYSGFTTIELASIIEELIVKHKELTGIWHVSSQPISKYDLLCSLSKKLNRVDVEIEREENLKCDRSLDGSKFSTKIGYKSPSWDVMLDGLVSQIISRRE